VPIAGCGGNCAAPSDCKDDGNPCTGAACVAGKCAFPAQAGACDDGDACSLDDKCEDGGCKPGKAKDCDDGEPCTSDSCKAGACQQVAIPGPCSDGNGCTEGDQCKAGKCAPGAAKACDDKNPCTADGCDPGGGNCTAAPNQATCDDGNPCTVADACAGSACQPGSPKPCDDGQPCTDDGCNAKTGACQHGANSLSCEDGSLCTVGDKCQGGACVPGGSKPCDDGNPCTLDACDPAVGTCSSTAQAGGCDDSNPCTEGDLCAGGKCLPGVAKPCDDGDPCTTDGCSAATGACTALPIVGCGGNCKAASDCNDQNPCTDDACNNGKCGATANAKPCDDKNPCTIEDACLGGLCKASKPKPCDDQNPCTDDACDAKSGACTSQANQASCSDNDPCTLADACQNGKCTGGKPLACNDGKLCTDDSCDKATGSCKTAANSLPCDDGKACTVGDKCADGSCTAGGPKACDDANPCTTDQCDAGSGACQFTANSATCNDGDACTLGDVCQAKACKPGTQKVCNDGNPCTDDACAPTTGDCKASANTAACSDGNACTLGDACKLGACQAGTPKACDDGDACTQNACSTGTGACQFQPIIGCGGNCTSSANCQDGNLCTDDLCSAGKCAFTNNTAACDDGDKCTSGDKCSAGKCASGTPQSCNDSNPCTADTCTAATGACAYPPSAGGCSDGDACTLNDQCAAGKCSPGTAKVCDDANPCTTDSCTTSSGACLYSNNGKTCDDGNPCTVSDFCGLGKCSGSKKDCNDNNVCTQDSCDVKSGCVNSAVAAVCSDGDPCSVKDACVAGKCKGTPNCDDGNPCTDDVCTPGVGCKYPYNNAPCGPGAECFAGACEPLFHVAKYGTVTGPNAWLTVAVVPNAPKTLIGIDFFGMARKSPDLGKSWTKLCQMPLPSAWYWNAQPGGYWGWEKGKNTSLAVSAAADGTAYVSNNEALFRVEALDGAACPKLPVAGTVKALQAATCHVVGAATGNLFVLAAQYKSSKNKCALLKSTDQGKTFTELGTLDCYWDPQASLAVDSSNEARVLAAVPPPNLGTSSLWSSVDAGKTWKTVLDKGSHASMDVAHPGVAFASNGQSFWRSADGGQTWTFDAALGLTSRAWAHDLKTGASYRMTDAGNVFKLWRTPDLASGGWVEMPAGKWWAEQVGGSSEWARIDAVGGTVAVVTPARRLYVSADDAKTFTLVGADLSKSAELGVAGLAVDGDTLIAARTDWSIAKSTDGGDSFTTAVAPVTTPLGWGDSVRIAVNPVEPKHAVAVRYRMGGSVYDARVLVSHDGFTTATMHTGGVSAVNVVLAARATDWKLAYLFGDTAGCKRSLDGGDTFKTVACGYPGNTIFYAPAAVVDPNDANITWLHILTSKPTRTMLRYDAAAGSATDQTLQLDAALGESVADIASVKTATGWRLRSFGSKLRLAESADGGKTWTQLANTGVATAQPCFKRRLLTAPGNPNLMAAVLHATSPAFAADCPVTAGSYLIAVSKDGGKSWAELSGQRLAEWCQGSIGSTVWQSRFRDAALVKDRLVVACFGRPLIWFQL